MGVVDGLWTISASLGSKIQMLTLLAVAGRSMAVEGVGAVAIALAIASIVIALTDFGLSPMAVRLFASGQLTRARQAFRPMIPRVGLDFFLGAASISYYFRDLPTGERVGWMLAVGSYAVGLHLSGVSSQIAYGMFRFRSGAAINGSIRLISTPAILVAGATSAPLYALIGVVAMSELIISTVQLLALRNVGRPELVEGAAALLSTRRTWRMGLTSLTNILLNKADVVLVGVVASTAIVGVYGLASQVENALTTLALVPAGSLVAYTARATPRESAVIRRRVTTVVLLAYAAAAVPLLAAPELIVEGVFGISDFDSTPLRICVVAGALSCVASVQMQQLVGLGEQTSLLWVWLVAGGVTVIGLLLGTYLLDSTGASLGALARDLTLLVTSAYFIREGRPRGAARASGGSGTGGYMPINGPM